MAVKKAAVTSTKETSTAKATSTAKTTSAAKETNNAKTTSKTKPTVKKAKAAKKEIYLQFGDKEMLIDEVTQTVQNIWTKDLGNKISDIETFKIYIKPSESAAYYVVNDISGKIEL